jgi:hypothetical protein
VEKTMKKILAFKILFLMSVMILGLISFLGCASKNNVKDGYSSEASNDQKPKPAKNENYQNQYKERYQDSYY